MIGSDSQIESQSWSFDVTRRGALVQGDSLGFRVSQPLRVSGGGINFDLPVAFDFETETPVIGRQFVSLAPDGREVMSEINWTGSLPIGTVSTSVFFRTEPGHFQNAPDDVGALVSLRRAF